MTEDISLHQVIGQNIEPNAVPPEDNVIQSASLRLSQLRNTPKQTIFASPTMSNIEAAEPGTLFSELVTSKDNLLLRCKDAIQELHTELDLQKYFH